MVYLPPENEMLLNVVGRSNVVKWSVISGGHKWRVQLLFNHLLLIGEQTEEEKKNSLPRTLPLFSSARLTAPSYIDKPRSSYKFTQIPRTYNSQLFCNLVFIRLNINRVGDAVLFRLHARSNANGLSVERTFIRFSFCQPVFLFIDTELSSSAVEQYVQSGKKFW